MFAMKFMNYQMYKQSLLIIIRDCVLENSRKRFFGLCNSTLLGTTGEVTSARENVCTYILGPREEKRVKERERERDAKRGRIVQTGKQTQPARVRRYSLFQSHRPIVR